MGAPCFRTPARQRCGRSIAFSAALVLFLRLGIAGAQSLPAAIVSPAQAFLDAGLVVNANTLLARQGPAAGCQFIDVQRPDGFNALHIPGALNIPLHAIKTKAYLRSRPLVLVDRGLSSLRLQPVCRQLRQDGFDARLLDGGLNAWRSHGGAVVADAFQTVETGSLSPATFFEEKNLATRVVCDVSPSRSPASLQLLPDAVHLPLTGPENRRLAVVQRFQRTRLPGASEILLLVDEKGQTVQQAKRVFDRAGGNTVFTLAGGVRAYQAYRKSLVRSWRSPEDRLVFQDPCQPCGDKGGVSTP